MHTIDGFLLSRQWRDRADATELVFWLHTEDGPVRAVFDRERPVCFVERAARHPLLTDLPPGAERRPLELRSLAGRQVDGLYFRAQRDLQAFRQRATQQGLVLHESDIKPTDRFLMERFITGGLQLVGEPVARNGYREYLNPRVRHADYVPQLSFCSIDIETSDIDGEVISVALVTATAKCVFLVGATPVDAPAWLRTAANEGEAIRATLEWIRREDPDLIIGWNVVNFDLDFIERRCQRLGIPFNLGRDDEPSVILQPQDEMQTRVTRINGRVVLDGIDALRMATWSFESFALDYVAQKLLGRGKLIEETGNRLAAIQRLYREDPLALARYNLEDAQLVVDIFHHADLFAFIVQRARMTGLALDRSGGSVAAFDNRYLPRLHRRGRVAPDIGADPNPVHSPGGFVMESRPGLYDNVLVLDFKSLYPSIIRSFNIDPLALAEGDADGIPGFLGAHFAREPAILPELIEALWQERDAAKRQGNAASSQAIKILMNSFYGVLGSFGCRFFDPRLASSITRRGHEIINRSRGYIEHAGYDVIYGDTDSVFVLLGPGLEEARCREIGNTLAQGLNQWWRETLAGEFAVDSKLEIEFETHYLRFLMPTVRGAETGSKKRYAGYVRDGETFRLVFKGLESVRSDWTPLAREFQQELYRRVFFDEPYEQYIRDTVSQLHAGALDEKLVYRKRLRRRLDDYQRNVPPHVQAARKLKHPGRRIAYVITAAGPEPATQITAALDYAHYEERQLRPVADGILHFLGQRFDDVVQRQMQMF